MEKNNRVKIWFLLFWLASAAALAGALISQFVFGLHPCELCLYQRVPYSVAIAYLTPLFFYHNIAPSRLRWIFILLALVFLSNVGIAGYHAGVEYKWWQGFSDCASGNTPDSIEALTAAIMAAPAVRCDEPAFIFLGLSMAGWNILYALGLTGVALWRSRKIA